METDVPRSIVYDGTNWCIHILNRRVGPMIPIKADAEKILHWLNYSGLQDMLDVVTDVIEKAFDEKEKKENGK